MTRRRFNWNSLDQIMMLKKFSQRSRMKDNLQPKTIGMHQVSKGNHSILSTCKLMNLPKMIKPKMRSFQLKKSQKLMLMERRRKRLKLVNPQNTKIRQL